MTRITPQTGTPATDTRAPSRRTRSRLVDLQSNAVRLIHSAWAWGGYEGLPRAVDKKNPDRNMGPSILGVTSLVLLDGGSPFFVWGSLEVSSDSLLLKNRAT